MRKLNVLIACEESQRVCAAFRELGHEAYSCDIQEPSGGHPEWHIKGDVTKYLNPTTTIDLFDDVHPLTFGITFYTMDGEKHHFRKWDLIIAHPPCTYLTVSGNRWFNVEKYGEKAIKRAKDREEGIAFFMKFVNADCDKIAIENPIGCMSTKYRKPDQIIQPYQFGHATRKSTCLWLKNLPCLMPTDEVEPEIIKYKNGKGTDDVWHMETIGLPADERRRSRSKTFPGIAKAMAEQWGNY